MAVASKFLAAGSVVPWARAGADAVATEAYANVTYGPRGLDMLETVGAEEVVQQLIAADDERDHRQLGVVDRNGSVASFSGDDCFDWAGSRAGEGLHLPGKHPHRQIERTVMKTLLGD